VGCAGLQRFSSYGAKNFFETFTAFCSEFLWSLLFLFAGTHANQRGARNVWRVRSPSHTKTQKNLLKLLASLSGREGDRVNNVVHERTPG